MFINFEERKALIKTLSVLLLQLDNDEKIKKTKEYKVLCELFKKLNKVK